ncbi:hypothetical protein [Rodentibacter trehalosifermentans]|nr:hypothetical protein [Rodentibacter trehalosifermentans]
MKTPNNKNKTLKQKVEENVILYILGFCVTTAIIVGSATFAFTKVIISDK